MLVVYTVFGLGFAWFFHVNYAFLPEFSSIYMAFSSLTGILCGTVDPETIFVGYGKSWKQYGALMASVYVFINGFVILSIMIGVTGDHYSIGRATMK